MFLEFYRLVSGRALVFQLLPRLLKDLWKLERACVLVVTPLVSIMKDQVEELTGLGLRAFAIGLGDEKGEKELVAGGFDVDVIYGIYYICFPRTLDFFFSTDIYGGSETIRLC